MSKNLEPTKGVLKRIVRPCHSVNDAAGGVAGTDGACDVDESVASKDKSVMTEEIGRFDGTADGRWGSGRKRKSFEELPGEQHAGDEQLGENQQAGGSEPLGSKPVEGHPVKIAKSKRTRYSRRAASRSEPVGKAPDFSTDGAADSRHPSGSSVHGGTEMSGMAMVRIPPFLCFKYGRRADIVTAIPGDETRICSG